MTMAARKVPQHGPRVDWYARWLAARARVELLETRLNFALERADNLERENRELRDELRAEIQRIGLAMVRQHEQK